MYCAARKNPGKTIEKIPHAPYDELDKFLKPAGEAPKSKIEKAKVFYLRI